MDSRGEPRYPAAVPVLHALANPTRFLKIARPLTPVLFWLGVALAGFGIWAGLTQTPPDYLQGETVRIMYLHIPAAVLGEYMGAGTVALASLGYLIWRHPLAHVAAVATAPVGAVFAGLCLATGSIWGRPTWGTWWEWDGRLTSMLILFFIYIAYIALARADADRGGDGRIPALFGVAGSVMVPIVHFSVEWWHTLHQGSSIGLTSSKIDSSILWPLWFTLFGFSLFFVGVVLMRMRAALASQKVEARMRRMAAQ